MLALARTDDQPAHRRQLPIERVLEKLVGGYDVVVPQRSETNVGNGVERGPDIPGLSLTGRIVFPTQPLGLQAVRQGLEIEARVFRCDVAIVVHHLHGGVPGGVAAPTVLAIRRIVDRSAGLRADGIEMVWEAWASERGEESIGQDKVAGIGEVVGQVVLGVLGVGEVVAVLVPSGNEVKLVHGAAVDGLDGALEGVADVSGGPVGSVAQGNHISGRDPAGGGAIGAGKSAEVVVKGAILLNEKNNVPDLFETLVVGPVFPAFSMMRLLSVSILAEGRIAEEKHQRGQAAQRRGETNNVCPSGHDLPPSCLLGRNTSPRLLQHVSAAKVARALLREGPRQAPAAEETLPKDAL